MRCLAGVPREIASDVRAAPRFNRNLGPCRAVEAGDAIDRIRILTRPHASVLRSCVTFPSSAFTVNGPSSLGRTPPTEFVTRNGTKLYVGASTAAGNEFRAVGPNIYWLGLDENIGEPGTISYPSQGRVLVRRVAESPVSSTRLTGLICTSLGDSIGDHGHSRRYGSDCGTSPHFGLVDGHATLGRAIAWRLQRKCLESHRLRHLCGPSVSSPCLGSFSVKTAADTAHLLAQVRPPPDHPAGRSIRLLSWRQALVPALPQPLHYGRGSILHEHRRHFRL